MDNAQFIVPTGITPADRRAVESHAPARATDNRLRLIDIGASGGLEPMWHPYGNHLAPVLFEPNAEAAQALRDTGYAHVVEAALSSTDGPRILCVTHNPLCISLHRPNPAFVAAYDMHEHFHIDREIPIQCRRYDSLHREGAVPQPDVIKIDTQGHEFDVLLGFGALLADCIGIVLETHTYPIYQGEHLLDDLIRLLEPFGLVLRRLDQTPATGIDFVEADAYFTANRHRFRRMMDVERQKFDLLTEIWRLPRYW